MPRRAGAFFAALALASSPVAARADSPPEAAPVPQNKLAIAREIVAISMPPDMREKMYFATMDQIVGQMREAQGDESDDPQIQAIVDKHLKAMTDQIKSVTRAHIPALVEALADAYAVIFSKDELNDILAFVRTPSGRKFVVMSRAVIAEDHVVAANQDLMNEITALIPEYKEALQEEITEYLLAKEAATEANKS
jgi:hypothetical protein